ncbi:MAG: hypothetical protein ORN23_07905 [Chthoniobacterales bacterium]|nr:hypothetical protein [Chthoniobacterales bacterium]
MGTILLGIFLLLLLAANLTLQLPGIKDRIRSTLTSFLGTPISVESFFLNPAGGIRLSKVTVTPTEQLATASADSLTIYISWADLLKGKITPEAISLIHPVAILKLGSGSTPIAPKLPALTSQTLITTPSARGITVSSSPAEQPQQPQSNKSDLPPNLASLLSRLSIQHGEFSLLDEASHPVLRLNDLNAHQKKGKMKIMATSAVISDSLIVHDLAANAEATSKTNGATLMLENISAMMGDGRITGALRCELPPSSPDYNCSIQLSGAGLRKLLGDASLGSPNAEGQIDGDLMCTGTAGIGATMTGKGSLRCKEAVIEPVAFLKQIGQLLNVDELKLLKLAEGRCLFRIDQGHVVIDELFLRSANLILAAKGPLQPSGELNLDSRLLFNEKLTGRLHGLLGSQLSPAPEPGYSQVTFHVSGPASNPRTDLIERLTGIHLGGNLGGLGGLLQGLFGKPAPQAPAMPQPAH